MILDSWRYGFVETEDGVQFSFSDSGPFVAYEAAADCLTVLQDEKLALRDHKLELNRRIEDRDAVITELKEQLAGWHSCQSDHAPDGLTPGSKWQHYTHGVFTVIGLANLHDAEEAITVVYSDDKRRVGTKPLDVWRQVTTRIG
jgi:hypothetical protein